MKSMYKIAIVGPIQPYRGGIAQYNTQLHESLKKVTKVTAYSFKKMYPSFMYPGATQTEAKDSSVYGVKYMIKFDNPLSVRRLAKQIVADGNEVALITWWTLIWQPGMAYLSHYLRRKGVKTVFICHNVVDHDSSGFKNLITKKLIKIADGYIVHATEEQNNLRALTEKPIYNSKSLPIYDFYPKPSLEFEKRGRLELLFFGFVRPYKGLDDLLQALSLLQDKKIYLTVVGEVWGDEELIRDQLKDLYLVNVELQLKYVSDVEAANYFKRADVVVLPYRSATGSAVAALAYNYRKPILGTSVGGLKDVIVPKKTGWLVPPNSPEKIADTLRKLTRKEAVSLEKTIGDFCDEHSWNKFAEKIASFLKEQIM